MVRVTLDATFAPGAGVRESGAILVHGYLAGD
jgi:hypothetical protein